jgi:hypothetical protein
MRDSETPMLPQHSALGGGTPAPRSRSPTHYDGNPNEETGTHPGVPNHKAVKFTACLASALLLVTLGSSAQARTTPAVWTAIASKLAGRYTSVSCGRLSRAYGVTYMSMQPRIVLDTSVCASLRAAPRVPPADATPTSRMTPFIAIQTLAHESMHAKGIRSENRAECEGLKHFVWVAMQLGFARWQAQGLLRFEIESDRSLRCSI